MFKEYMSRLYDFWICRVGLKIVELCISIKVLTLVAMICISTWLITHGYIDGGNWTTATVSTITVVFGTREIVKIARLYGDKLDNLPGGKFLKKYIDNNTQDSRFSHFPGDDSYSGQLDPNQIDPNEDRLK